MKDSNRGIRLPRIIADPDNITMMDWKLSLLGRSRPGLGYWGWEHQLAPGLNVSVKPDVAFRLAAGHPRPERATATMERVERDNLGKFPWHEVRLTLSLS